MINEERRFSEFDYTFKVIIAGVSGVGINTVKFLHRFKELNLIFLFQ